MIRKSKIRIKDPVTLFYMCGFDFFFYFVCVARLGYHCLYVTVCLSLPLSSPTVITLNSLKNAHETL